MRSVARPRRHIPRYRLLMLRPLLRYSITREAFVLRAVGDSVGPVLRSDRRRRLRKRRFDGIDRRGASSA